MEELGIEAVSLSLIVLNLISGACYYLHSNRYRDRLKTLSEDNSRLESKLESAKNTYFHDVGLYKDRVESVVKHLNKMYEREIELYLEFYYGDSLKYYQMITPPLSDKLLSIRGFEILVVHEQNELTSELNISKASKSTKIRLGEILEVSKSLSTHVKEE